jgi:TldD protein
MSEIVATFKPFENKIDFGKTLKIINKSLEGADDGELYLEKTRSEGLTFDDQKLRNANYNSSEGFGLRAVNEEKIGYAHSSEVSEEAILRASKTVRLAIDRNLGVSPPPSGTNLKLYSDMNPMDSISFHRKIELLKEIDDYARSLDRRVIQVTISLGASQQEIAILRPDGNLLTDMRPMVRININVIVEENGRRESGSSGSGGRFDLKELTEPNVWKKHANESLRIALVNLEAIEAPAGLMDVVLGPGWPGVLLHEAVGHGLEGDFNRKNTSAFSGLLGKKVASEEVTIVDDGTIENRRGSVTIDDEGTPGERTVLIENGRLINYMQDRQNARLMGMKETGNGRRQSYAHSPMPRMTNTFMLGGKEMPKNIISSLKNGIYAVGFSGGQVDITNGKFVFSCTEAYRVVDGKIQEPVRGATLIGDGATAMKKVRAVGDDLALDPGIGNCGKAGQWVPVGVGQPTLMIGGLTIGGSKTA